MQVDPSKVEFLRAISKFQIERGNFVVACVRPLYNVKLGISRRSRAVTAKKCTKKRDARANVLFWLLNLLLF